MVDVIPNSLVESLDGWYSPRQTKRTPKGLKVADESDAMDLNASLRPSGGPLRPPGAPLRPPGLPQVRIKPTNFWPEMR